ncbi:MAG TPA: ABC transporter substrate-binding protein [Streptosporangiaceae bacterium]|jgi:raffinose/stachyose/melibiose transport system substrate-binding protein|nr:ABC transporter substrate-binding protein [Streptosporangiaceae bacterium]
MPDDLSRRSFLAAAGGVAAAAGLSACGTSAGSPSGGPITLWISFQEIQQEQYFKEQYVNPWNKSHPSTPLDITVKPSNTLVQLQQTAVGAGAGPDILAENGSSTVIPLAQAKQILPLDKYASEYGWNKALLPWAFAASTWQGKLWSVPNAYETMLMYYNPATFAKHGWKPPTDLQETEALFAEAHGRGIQPITAGNAGFRAATEWLATMFWNHYSGPDALYQALSGQIKWTNPVFVEPLQILQRWFSNGWIGVSSQNYFTTQFATCYKNLATGQAATYWSGTWEFANLPLYFGKAGQNNATWTWANIPQMRAGIPKVVNELSIGGTYSINARAKDPDAVARFLGWYLANKKAAVIGLKRFGNEPPPLALSASDWVPGTNPNFSRCYDEMAVNSKAGNIGYTTWTFWPPKSDTYIIDSMDGVITGSTKPQDFCAGLDNVFRTELAQHRVPPLFKPGASPAL